MLALVLTIASMWIQQAEDATTLVPASVQRQMIKDAVARITTPER